MDFELLPNGRKALWVKGQGLEVALAHGGGHIAGLRVPGAREDVNPYWQPPWPSVEPGNVTEAQIDADYGGAPEGRLLASILGHSLALDLYGAPSKEETAAGGVTHGKAGVLVWKWKRDDPETLTGECEDDHGRLHFSRSLCAAGNCVEIEERVQNLCAWDRPIGWQQHVSLGPPFIEAGFWAISNCDLGSTHPESFGAGASLIPSTETRWPLAPLRSGGLRDYRRPLDPAALSNDFTGYRVRPSDKLAYFVAGNARFGFAMFYVWPGHFFPWMGVWEEQHARTLKPWCGRTTVRAFEFGVSPFPLTRLDLLRRPLLFDVPTYIILPAGATLWVRYALGVFRNVKEGDDLVASEESAVLMSGGHDVARVPLNLDWLTASKRTDYD